MKNSWEKQMAKEIVKLTKEIKQVVPEVYACFIKILYEEGMSADEIEDLVIKTQQAWEENVDRRESMIEWCYEVTGIDVRGV